MSQNLKFETEFTVVPQWKLSMLVHPTFLYSKTELTLWYLVTNFGYLYHPKGL